MTMKAIILTGSVRYEKDYSRNHTYLQVPIWKLCTETMKQFESEQYILQKGFVKVEDNRHQ